MSGFFGQLLLVWFVASTTVGKSGASTEFVFTFLEPQTDEISASTPYLLITSPSSEPVDVTVEVPGISFTSPFTISPTEPYANITLPTNIYLRGEAKQNKAIIIQSDARIFVYAAYIYDNYRASGFSVFPTTQLGQMYFVSSYGPDSGEYSEYSVTALNEQTVVQLRESGQTTSITLQPYETYQSKSTSDLTGSKITADKPVSVMSGSSASHVLSTSGGPEYMVAHIPPVEQLGTTYVLAPFRDRTSGYVFRVIATQPQTSVELSDNSQFIIDNHGEYEEREIDSAGAFAIVADKPILVAQFSESHHTDTYGDTFMLIIPPTRAVAKEDISFPITTLRAASEVSSYLSITLDCDHIDAVTVDGENIDITGSEWTEQRVSIDQASYCNLQREYEHGAHHIVTPGRNVPYEAIVYGFSQKYVAYAFTLWGLTQGISQYRESGLFEAAATSITCENSQMVVLLNSSYVANGQFSEVHLVDPSCTGQAYANDTIQLVTDFNQCGTTMSVEETSLVFYNKLIYRAPRPQKSNNNTMPRYFDLNIELSCTVPRRGNSSYGPMFGPIKANEAGSGHLKFSLEMYPDSNYNVAYDSRDFPMMIDEGQDIFLAASVSDVTEVTLSIEVCKVTPTRDPEDVMQRVIMENGCGQYHPITFYESPNNSQQRFSTAIDSYFSANPMMFIHCSMIVCSSNDTDLCPRTNTNCAEPRPARDVGTSALMRVTVSTAGPLVIRTTSHLTDNNAPNKTSVILVAVGVVSLVLVILILAIVVLKKGYRRYHASYNTLKEVLEMDDLGMTNEGGTFKYVPLN